MANIGLNAGKNTAVCAAKTINRLFGVAYREQLIPLQVFRVPTGQKINDLSLSFINILAFIDHQVAKSLQVAFANRRMIPQQSFCAALQIVVGQCAALLLRPVPALRHQAEPFAEVRRNPLHLQVEQYTPVLLRRRFATADRFAEVPAAAQSLQWNFQSIKQRDIVCRLIDPACHFQPIGPDLGQRSLGFVQFSLLGNPAEQFLIAVFQ